MKFYYNGKLMRTSKTHDYKFAIVNPSGSCWSCHGTLDAAQKEFRRPIAELEQAIENSKAAIKALKAGKTYYNAKSGRNTYPVKLSGKIGELKYSDISTWEYFIDKDTERMEYLKTRKIVELEARA